ncbi:hypothetical protein FIBSPDRAFT_961194 [Athelia psychrophila]|uniref:Uncharacterized protein n=1 Tax=Athelia psychrophila TaxID=1759441 RepID=A0A166BKY5_9AGAM|nr:hypothetical protein FIBSPDRAFT_961194 [Fibularhizoctonia sp. CBS 109695]
MLDTQVSNPPTAISSSPDAPSTRVQQRRLSLSGTKSLVVRPGPGAHPLTGNAGHALVTASTDAVGQTPALPAPQAGEKRNRSESVASIASDREDGAIIQAPVFQPALAPAPSHSAALLTATRLPPSAEPPQPGDTSLHFPLGAKTPQEPSAGGTGDLPSESLNASQHAPWRNGGPLPPGFSRSTTLSRGPPALTTSVNPPGPNPSVNEHPTHPLPAQPSLIGNTDPSEINSPSTTTQGNPARQNVYIDPQSGLEYVRMDASEEENFSTPLPSPPKPQAESIDNYLISLAASNNRRRQREAEAAVAAPPPAIPGTLRTVERPEAGWPRIHGSNPGYLWDGIAEDQMGQWLDDRKPNVLVQVHGKNSWDAEAGQTADDIAGIIKAIYNIETVSVAPGNEQLDENGESRNKNKNDPPHTFLVQDISPVLAHRLIATTCIATATLQLMFYPLRFIGPHTYIGSLSGLVATNLIQISSARQEQLCDDIRDLLYKQAHEPLMAFVCRDIPEDDFSDVAMNPDDEVLLILGNLEIKVMKKELRELQKQIETTITKTV